MKYLTLLQLAFFTAASLLVNHAFAAMPQDLEFVKIPEGKFKSQVFTWVLKESEFSEYSVRAFELQTTEVSQLQWLQVMGNNPSFHSRVDDCIRKHEIRDGISLCPGRPVENVNIEEIQTFISRLNVAQEEFTYYLPDARAWEYAASAGSTYYEAVPGNPPDSILGDFDTGEKLQTTDVRNGQKNKFGLYNMEGNVWEWCAGWNGNELIGYRWARVGSPNFYQPDIKKAMLGFRLARISGRVAITRDSAIVPVVKMPEPPYEGKDDLSIQTLLKGKYFFEQYEGVYFAFEEKNGHVFATELMGQGEVYSHNYENLDCGEKAKLDVSQSFQCTKGTGIFLIVKMNLNEKTEKAYLSLFLGPNAGQRDYWVRR